MPKSKFAKAVAAALIAAGITVIPAWTALAVTNPADNPHPITVTGDDGNTYNDGADTLPGYDDEECTYIPGAWFDFAHNKVHYADGQSIPWTEWDRASGYSQWLAAQSNSNSGVAPTPAPTESATSTGSGATKKNTTKTGNTQDVQTDTTTEVIAVDSEVVTEVPTLTFAAEVAEQNNPGRETGLVILGSLLLLGVTITVAGELRTRLRGGTN